MQVVLDVDTGVDDALAILLALRSPPLDVLAITCTAGNTDVDQVVRNTRQVLAAAAARPVPVGRGRAGPSRPPRLAHGRDGMADLGLPEPPATDLPTAVDLLSHSLGTATEPVVLLALGPLTNVADLARVDPAAIDRLARVVVVGDAPDDANVAADPAASAAVRATVQRLTVVPTAVFRTAVTERRAATTLEASPDPAVRLAGALLGHQHRRFGGVAVPIGDAGVVASLLRPDLVEITSPEAGPAVVTRLDGASLGALLLEVLGGR